MSQTIDLASRRIYRGVWAVLVQLFRVPHEPPTLPAADHRDTVESFRPAEGFLRYLKFWFWILLWPMDVVIAIVMVVLLFTVPILFFILLIPALVLAILPDVIAYIALHLKYDTMWYVMTDRSLRIRRGIWTIHEVTITFENVQDISVQSGPVQRHFGIANLTVHTAGGGVASGPHGEKSTTGHVGIIEGIANAPELRDRIMARLRQSKSAGLGDEEHPHDHRAALAAPAWTRDHLEALRAIHDELRAMTAV